MPVFDKICRACGWSTDFGLEPSNVVKPCPKCGGETERLFIGRAPLMIPDTFTTPLVDSVMTAETQVFQSRSEHRRAMELNGVRNDVHHSCVPGTDKSKLTENWNIMPPKEYMDGILAMMERMAHER